MNKKFNKSTRWIISLLSICFWIGVWYLLAFVVAQPLLLPMPHLVFSRLFSLLFTAEFWRSTALSLLRVFGGICFGTLSAMLLAPLTAFYPSVETIVKPILTVVKSTPVSSFIILAMLWIDRSQLPIFISFLLVFPTVWNNLHTGLRHVPQDLCEVSRIYRFSFWKKLRVIYIPSVLPYFESAARASLGLAWKSGIAAEVLALPALSIGKHLYETKLNLETTDLFAWTCTVIIFSILLEKAVVSLLHFALGAKWNQPNQTESKGEPGHAAT